MPKKELKNFIEYQKQLGRTKEEIITKVELDMRFDDEDLKDTSDLLRGVSYSAEYRRLGWLLTILVILAGVATMLFFCTSGIVEC